MALINIKTHNLVQNQKLNRIEKVFSTIQLFFVRQWSPLDVKSLSGNLSSSVGNAGDLTEKT